MSYVPLSTYLTPELKIALNQRANEDGKTVRDVVEAALASYLASKDESPPVKRLSGIVADDAIEHGLHVMTWLHAQGMIKVHVDHEETDFRGELRYLLAEAEPQNECLELFMLVVPQTKGKQRRVRASASSRRRKQELVPHHSSSESRADHRDRS